MCNMKGFSFEKNKISGNKRSGEIVSKTELGGHEHGGPVR